jgi:MFS family permease
VTTAISATATSRGTFRSLKHKNARLFFTGIWVSQIGSWMQTIASALLVKSLAPAQFEGVLIGTTIAAQFFPMLLLGAWCGAFADQRNRWKVTVTTQALLAAQALTLGIVTLSGAATIPVIIGLTLAQGVVNAFDNPARRGVVIELVEPKDIPNVTSLNTAAMTGSRAIGPAIAALAIPRIGFGWCFTINGISFIAILLALFAMDQSKLHRAPPAPRGGTPVRDGLRFVWHDRMLRRVFVLMVIIATFTFNYQVSLPLLVDDRWHEPDAWYGILLAVVSLGSFLGSLLVASMRTVDERRYLQLTALLGVSALAIAFAPNIWVALVLAVPMGIGGAGFLSVGNGITQLRSPDAMRSRMLALTAVAFLGSTPIGGPFTGAVADVLGAEWSMAYGGIIGLAATAISWLVYRRTAYEPITAVETPLPRASGSTT